MDEFIRGQEVGVFTGLARSGARGVEDLDVRRLPDLALPDEPCRQSQ